MSKLLAYANSLELYRGEYKELELFVTGSSGALNLTNAVLYFTVKRFLEDEFPVLRKSSSNPAQIEITDARGGEAIVHITQEDSALLTEPTYWFDVWVTVSGRRSVVIPPTEITVLNPITHF